MHKNIYKASLKGLIAKLKICLNVILDVVKIKTERITYDC